jgi:predicted alpha/beta hydrolase family esterase
MIQHIVIAPRWGGTPLHDWYPWFLSSFRERLPSPPSVLEALDLPNPSVPTVEDWPRTIATRLLSLHEEGALQNTLVIGHSVGCQAVLRALLSLPGEARVGGLLMVAGWWTIDSPWDSIRPWLTTPTGSDLAHIRAISARTEVLLSDNDPFTADAAANAALWTERLGAEVSILPGLKHLNRAEEPAVLDAVSRWL